MKLKIMVLASVMLAVPMAVSAGSPMPLMPGSFEISAGGGVSMPSGDFGDLADPGFGFGGHGSFYVMPSLAVGGSIVYNSYGTSSEVETATGITGQSMWEFTAHGKYMFMPGPVSPYVKATAGIFRYSAEVQGFGSGSSSNFGVGGGIGAQMRLPASNVGFFAEGMMYSVSTDGPTLNYMGIRGGLNYYITPKP